MLHVEHTHTTITTADFPDHFESDVTDGVLTIVDPVNRITVLTIPMAGTLIYRKANPTGVQEPAPAPPPTDIPPSMQAPEDSV